MAHDHGNEYQIKIVHDDDTEELSGWINSEEQVAQAMAAVHRPRAKGYWLRERNVLCPNCLDTEQSIVEYPSYRYPVSTMQPTRLPLSGGSGVDGPVCCSGGHARCCPCPHASTGPCTSGTAAGNKGNRQAGGADQGRVGQEGCEESCPEESSQEGFGMRSSRASSFPIRSWICRTEAGSFN